MTSDISICTVVCAHTHAMPLLSTCTPPTERARQNCRTASHLTLFFQHQHHDLQRHPILHQMRQPPPASQQSKLPRINLRPLPNRQHKYVDRTQNQRIHREKSKKKKRTPRENLSQEKPNPTKPTHLPQLTTSISPKNRSLAPNHNHNLPPHLLPLSPPAPQAQRFQHPRNLAKSSRLPTDHQRRVSAMPAPGSSIPRKTAARRRRGDDGVLHVSGMWV